MSQIGPGGADVEQVPGERSNSLAAAAYSLGVSMLTYGLFAIVLKTPLEPGPFGF